MSRAAHNGRPDATRSGRPPAVSQWREAFLRTLHDLDASIDELASGDGAHDLAPPTPASMVDWLRTRATECCLAGRLLDCDALLVAAQAITAAEFARRLQG